ncbi:MAG: hypothetical protein LBR61_11280 [Synergistaceae bacterium]|jgi:hypothetical protein|nr:hypothetical protein [Synergistaceae bacterium]
MKKTTNGKITKGIAIVFGLFLILAAKNAGAALFDTDIVGRAAETSFTAMLKALPAKVTLDDSLGVWVLTAPDGSATFAWRRDARDGRALDAWLRFDAKPFRDAGLDLSKMPAGTVDGDEIVLGSRLSQKALSYEGEVTPEASFSQVVKLDRDLIGYHAALDHYGMTLSEGTIFEWAKDMSKNDKDIVFVLNPKPFLDAGVDPAKVEGWVFAKVPVEDERGRKYEADKFLKPFNLK